MDDLDALVSTWLTLPDVAQRLGVDVNRVRQLLQDRQLVALRRGERGVLSIPDAFLLEAAPLPELRGTLVVLADAGFSDADAVRWLFTTDDSLGGSPLESLREGRKTEIRRRAQALAL